MLLSGKGEFRGSENRKSKNGNEYKIFKFEDSKGTAFQFYCNPNNTFSMSTLDLVKGNMYELRFELRFNSYQNHLQVDLLDFMDSTDEM